MARRTLIPALGLAAALLGGCSKEPLRVDTAPSRHHHHHAPHGGTPIELGEEEYHVELVLDEPSGNLQAYILDAEMENFVRSTAASIEIRATVKGAEQKLVLVAVANAETGETVGDTSLFEAPAGWVRSTGSFDGVLSGVVIRGTNFGDVKFNFPKGNDTDG